MNSTHSIPRGFTGTISLGLTELIQMVCLSRSDLVIGVTSGSGKASIYIRQGQIQHAQTDSLTGTDAFLEVARWVDGRFEILPYENNVPCSVNKPWEYLLLEAIRLQDEKGMEGGEENSPADSLRTNGEKPGPDILDGVDDVLGDFLELGSPAGVLEPEKSPAPEAVRTSVKVLIVEDSTFFAKRLKTMLESEGTIEVVGIARNGRESLEFLKAGTHVDLITLDVTMPVMDGDTALKHIMIQYHTPAIIVSSQQQESLQKILNFLQLGAVDYIAKPGVTDDPVSYGARLRKLVTGAAGARISNFKRLRTPDFSGAIAAAPPRAAARRKTLVVVGAEGAHMDWFRLPLRQLCAHAAVIGLQQLEQGLAPRFARFITEKTGIQTEYLSATHRIVPGKLYLSEARREPCFRIGTDRHMEVDVCASIPLEWETGLELWLQSLAEKLGDSLWVYYMSAAHPAPASLVAKLLDRGVRQVLAPARSAVCSAMIDSLQPYTEHFAGLVLHSSPDSLTEVLKL